MTTELLTQIKQLINPVHHLSCDEWMKVAEIENPTIKGMSTYIPNEVLAINLISRYESLCNLPLTRGMFCFPDNPAVLIEPEMLYQVEYTIAQNGERRNIPGQIYGKDMTEPQIFDHFKQKVLFDGFENFSQKQLSIGNSKLNFGLEFKAQGIYTNLFFVPNPATIFDFIIEIDRYNRSATQKISIHFTEAFVKMLVQ